MIEKAEMIKLIEDICEEMDRNLEGAITSELCNPEGTLSTARQLAGQRVGITYLGGNLIMKLREGEDNE